MSELPAEMEIMGLMALVLAAGVFAVVVTAVGFGNMLIAAAIVFPAIVLPNA